MIVKKWLPISAILALFIILRLPSLFEPHWYGDEGIYASVAYALEHGKKMYIDVFDNRLPGIYHLYSLATTYNRLLAIRLMNLGAGIITLLGIYAIGVKLGMKRMVYLGLIVALFLLGTPRIEANIANDENFFLPLTVWGIWFGLTPNKKSIFISGVLFGLAFMIKFVPAFTCVAVGLYLLFYNRSFKNNIQQCLTFSLGFVVPVAVSFFLFFLNGNLLQTIQYGLLNNTSYVTFYSHQGIPASVRLGGLLVALCITLGLYIKKRIPNSLLILLLVLLLDFYAATFSGRKYEHYLLQIVSGLSLMVGYAGAYIISKGIALKKIIVVIACIFVFFIGKYIFYKGSDLAIGMNIIEYYKEFVLASLKVHYEPKLPFAFYREPARLKIAKLIIKKYNTKKIYFYSDEAWIYDYNHIVPPTFFVASYHQYLVPNGFQRLVDDLQKSQVDVIAVDKKVAVTKEMQNYLKANYTEDLEDSYFKYYIPLPRYKSS